MSKKRRKAVRTQKPERVLCPYCHSQAKLVPASEVFKYAVDVEWAYVCGNYPECDSYVAAHKTTLRPMGPLANAELRRLRYEAHQVFDQIWKSGLMSKTDAYRWLASSLSMKSKDAHIGQFAEYYCRKTIELSSAVLGRK